MINTEMIGIMPRDVVQRDISSGTLAVINCKLNISGSPVGVSYREEDALSPAAYAFLEELRGASSSLSASK